jgi:hypothetical protein
MIEYSRNVSKICFCFDMNSDTSKSEIHLVIIIIIRLKIDYSNDGEFLFVDVRIVCLYVAYLIMLFGVKVNTPILKRAFSLAGLSADQCF